MLPLSLTSCDYMATLGQLALVKVLNLEADSLAAWVLFCSCLQHRPCGVSVSLK